MSAMVLWLKANGPLILSVVFALVCVACIGQIISVTQGLNDPDPNAVAQRQNCEGCENCDVTPDTAHPGQYVQVCQTPQDKAKCDACNPVYKSIISKYKNTRTAMIVVSAVSGVVAMISMIFFLVRNK